MSLINCPECKKQISDKASSCPGCGTTGPFKVKRDFSFYDFNINDVIGQPILINNLEIAQFDFPDWIEINWNDSILACEYLGNGWRLPTKIELNILYENKKNIGGFCDHGYWSSTLFDDYNAWFQSFSDDDFTGGFQHYDPLDITWNKIRAVKSI